MQTGTECPSRDQLAGYSSGTLPPEEATGVARHLENCPSCEVTIETLAASTDTLIEMLRTPTLSAESDLGQLLKEAAKLIGQHKPSTMTAPKQLRDYKLLEQVGRGGMGTVFRATHDHLQKTVAVKLLPPERTSNPHAVARFRREMRAVGHLDHPNIVVAHDAGEADGTHFLVMEFIQGVDASRLVDLAGPLPAADAAEIIRQAALGLQHAHEHSLVHRDIKPSNLMITRKGHVKVLDLGLALLSSQHAGGDELTDFSQPMGTVDYMAPEQAGDSHQVDIRADIYGLGCTFFKLLTGRSPYSGPGLETPLQKMMAHVSRPLPDLQAIRPEISAELVAVVNRMTTKSPADRYSTPAEVATAVLPFCGGANLGELLERAEKTPGRSNPVESFITQSLLSSPSRGTGPASLDGTQPGEKVTPLLGAQSHQRELSAPLRRRPAKPVWIALGAFAVIAALTGLVIRLQTADGTLVLSVEDPNVNVEINGEPASAEVSIDGRTLTIEVEPGTHTLAVTTADGVRLKTDDQFTIEAGGTKQLTAVFEKAQSPTRSAGADEDPDLAVAEWVFSVGGRVGILIGNEERWPRSRDELPRGKFKIKALDLNSCSFDDHELRRLQSVDAIDTLVLGYTKLTDAGLAHLKGHPSLKTLSITGTQLTDAAFDTLEHLPALERLGIGSNVKFTAQAWPRLKNLRNLEELGIANSRYYDTKESSFTNQDLASLQELPLLSSLSLTGTAVTEDGLAVLARIPALRSLQLTWAPATIDEGAAHLKKLPKLEHLAFSGVRVTDRGVEHISELHTLKRLTFPDSSISDSALQYLGRLKNLDSLQLEGPGITDTGLQHLSPLKQLKHLELKSVGATPLGIQRLQQALPGCKIEWSLAEQKVADLPPALNDRQAAEWLLELGAHVKIRAGSEQRAPQTVAALPNEPFVLIHVALGEVAFGDKDLARLRNLRNLGDLGIDRSSVTDAGLKHLEQMPALRVLTLPNHLGDGAFEHITQIKLLQGLYISGPAITSAGFARLRELPNLHGLTVANANFTDGDIVHLQALPKLHRLALSDTKITNAGLAEIARIQNLEHLSVITFGLSEEGLEPLSNLRELIALQINHMDITAKGAGYLARLPKLAHLETGALDDEALEVLCKMESLTTLNCISHGQVTRDGIQAVAEKKNLRQFRIQGLHVDSQVCNLLISLTNLERFFLSGRGDQTTIDRLDEAFKGRHFERNLTN